jgi:hypothetical protein
MAVFLFLEVNMRLERMTLYLTTQEMQALEKSALSDLRGYHEQARFLLREELTRRGLLSQAVKSINLPQEAKVESSTAA